MSQKPQHLRNEITDVEQIFQNEFEDEDIIITGSSSAPLRKRKSLNSQETAIDVDSLAGADAENAIPLSDDDEGAESSNHRPQKRARTSRSDGFQGGSFIPAHPHFRGSFGPHDVTRAKRDQLGSDHTVFRVAIFEAHYTSFANVEQPTSSPGSGPSRRAGVAATRGVRLVPKPASESVGIDEKEVTRIRQGTPAQARSQVEPTPGPPTEEDTSYGSEDDSFPFDIWHWDQPDSISDEEVEHGLNELSLNEIDHEEKGRPVKHQKRHIVSKVLPKSNIKLPPGPQQNFARRRPIGLKCPQPRRRLHTVYDCGPPRRTMHYAKTSGAIIKVAQSGSAIAAASAANGGEADEDVGGSRDTTYNDNKNLLAIKNDNTFVLDGHVKRHGSKETYYTVNDVSFDPLNPNRLVSTGNDGRVRTWNLPYSISGQQAQVANKNIASQTYKLTRATLDVKFKPGSSAFVFSCLDGNLYIVYPSFTPSPMTLVPAPEASVVKPSYFLWGGDSESNRLHEKIFASSESDDENVACRHVCFLAGSRTCSYRFDIDDSGDAMALDNVGGRLALITSRGSARHEISLFDVSRDMKRRVSYTSLRPHADKDRIHNTNNTPPRELEINSANFSPDGMFIALARNDNSTDIYDTRYLDRQWATLPHSQSNLSTLSRKDSYGAYGAIWVGGRGRGSMGLVTGGADCCVRLWDVFQSPSTTEESTVLAELNNDVAYIALGDPHKGEKRLIAGDVGGEVYAFD